MAHRTIRESHVAMHVIDAEIKRNPLLIDQYEALTWLLCRQPTAGWPIPGTDPLEYVLHSFHWPGLRKNTPMVLAYTFDDDVIVIWDLRVLHR